MIRGVAAVRDLSPLGPRSLHRCRDFGLDTHPLVMNSIGTRTAPPQLPSVAWPQQPYRYARYPAVPVHSAGFLPSYPTCGTALPLKPRPTCRFADPAHERLLQGEREAVRQQYGKRDCNSTTGSCTTLYRRRPRVRPSGYVGAYKVHAIVANTTSTATAALAPEAGTVRCTRGNLLLVKVC